MPSSPQGWRLLASSTFSAVADSMRSAQTALLCAFCLLASACTSMHVDPSSSGLPLGKSGWQLSGGIDLQKKCWFVCFVKPFGKAEQLAASGFAK